MEKTGAANPKYQPLGIYGTRVCNYKIMMNYPFGTDSLIIRELAPIVHEEPLTLS